MKKGKWLIAVAAGASIAGLAYALRPKKKVPDSAIVEPFDADRYMGLWHEIARLPNVIEKNLKNLTEEYTRNEDGSVKVITRAYHIEKNKPVEAEGKAKFKGRDTRGKLGVAYYLPFYLDYYVLDIDEEYKYALVSGSGFDYLWLLSRDTDIPEDIKFSFLEKAAGLGFDVTRLEWQA